MKQAAEAGKNARHEQINTDMQEDQGRASEGTGPTHEQGVGTTPGSPGGERGRNEDRTNRLRVQ